MSISRAMLGDKVDERYVDFINKLIALADLANVPNRPRNRAHLVRISVERSLIELITELKRIESAQDLLEEQLEEFKDVFTYPGNGNNNPR